MCGRGRHILFSGCAATHDRRPARDAMLGLAEELHLELEESAIPACCGARSTHDAGTPDARHLLAPLLAAASEGHEIVCLSPACRCALTTQLLGLAVSLRTTLPEIVRHPPRVVDCVGLLAQTAAAAARRRTVAARPSTLRVAVHGICHADHNPARWPSGRLVAMAFPRGGILRFTLMDTETADTALADLVAASGATVLDDVSVAGGCAQVPLPGGQLDGGGIGHGTMPCLASAAEEGADIVVTPCVLCYSALNRYQRTLDPRDPARRVPVLHLAQLAGVAGVAMPTQLGLRHAVAPSQQRRSG